MDEKPRRHWFRFSLRTMFVIVTILCIWFGWNLNKVRQRSTALTYLKQDGADVRLPADGWPMKPWHTVPLSLRLLGAEPVTRIVLPKGRYTYGDVTRVTELFPEAEIVVAD